MTLSCPCSFVLERVYEIPSRPCLGTISSRRDTLVEEAKAVEGAGVPAVILFGIPERKDAAGSGAYAADAVVCRAVEAVKKACPALCVITDVCLCEYTDHGHCGVIAENRDGVRDVDNDATLDLLVKEALAQVAAGADMVAPSDMMDGRVGAIRRALDEANAPDVPIMAYSAKYASPSTGPFGMPRNRRRNSAIDALPDGSSE